MSADRIFLDANILFSAAYGSRGLEGLWTHAEDGKCILLASAYVIEEAKRNLDTDTQLAKLETLLLNVEIFPEADPKIPCPIDLPDKDRPVLMAAILSKSGYLLTGDISHFGPYFGQTIHGVKISTAREYLRI